MAKLKLVELVFFCDIIGSSDTCVLSTLYGYYENGTLTFYGRAVNTLAAFGTETEKPYYQFSSDNTTYQYMALTLG